MEEKCEINVCLPANQHFFCANLGLKNGSLSFSGKESKIAATLTMMSGTPQAYTL